MGPEVTVALLSTAGAIVGGITGVYLAFLYNKQLEAKKISLAMKKMLAGKVIEAYESMYDIKKYLSDRKQNPYALVFSRDKRMTVRRKNVIDFIEGANRLVSSKHSLYLPANFKKKLLNFRNLLFEIIHHPSSGEDEEFLIQEDKIRKDIDQYIKDINTLSRDFKPDSIKEIKELLSYIQKDK